RQQMEKLKVLVVDDSRDTVELMQQLLEFDGHEVSVAFRAEEALETLKAFGPDVVLCDIGLPGMTGYEFAQAVREAEPGSPVYLVALTGYGSESDRARTRDAGFDEHLTKPVPRAELLAALERAARNRAASAPAATYT
ncbi:MAG TPA: response regulator, partial [Polyangiaceae bacterium]|nr:response regulator [Polyangiaceae bacterium]